MSRCLIFDLLIGTPRLKNLSLLIGIPLDKSLDIEQDNYSISFSFFKKGELISLGGKIYDILR